jgi:hypothetical protein
MTIFLSDTYLGKIINILDIANINDKYGLTASSRNRIKENGRKIDSALENKLERADVK